jgi:hypothetical protein
MLIPSWLYSGVLYGCLGVSFITLLYYAYRPKRPRAGGLPAAAVVASRMQRAKRWIPLACLVLPALAAFELNRVSHDVIRVREEGGTLHADRLVRLGEPPYPLAPGVKRSDLGLDHTWVINDSPRTVRIESVAYGSSMFGSSEPTQIPPGTAATAYEIENIGPSDPPPGSIEVEGVEAKLNSSTREWLTWDP